MAYRAVTDQLRDALESGDVLELEEAVNAARSATAHSRSPSYTALFLKAQDTFARHMRDCRSYLKPLRDACASLDESAIFQALLRAQEAPERVQLMMYSDIRNAEDLREDIRSAQDEVLGVLDCDDWRVVDRFLKQSAAVLDDRAVLALVQRREDLIKSRDGERRQSLSPQRAATRCRPPAEGARAIGTEYAPRYSDPCGPSHSSQSGFIPPLRSVSVGKPHYSSSGAVATEEAVQRQRILSDEHASRVQTYAAALLSGAADVSAPPGYASSELFPTVEDLDFADDAVEWVSPGWNKACASSPLVAPREVGVRAVSMVDEPEPLPRRSAPAPQSLNTSSTVLSTPRPLATQTYNRVHTERSAVVAPPEDAASGEVRTGLKRVPSLPLSPILSTPAATSLGSHAAPLTHRDDSAAVLQTLTPIHRPPTMSSFTPLPPATKSDDGASLAAQRAAARLRAVVRDEDVRRQDIEGTEEFDRSVFLMPAAARIQLMRRTQLHREATLRLY